MAQDLDRLADTWTELGETDPLWAILTDTSKAGGRWSPEEFFATGRAEIDDTFRQLEALGIEVQAGAALDFGCGIGRLTQPLGARFERVIGLDIAPTMIALAVAHDRSGGNVTYRVNQSSQLDGVADACLDFVYSNIVLQHIPPQLSAGYIREFGRVLRAGGIAVFQLPSEPRTAFARFKTALKRTLPRRLTSALKAVYRRRRIAPMDMYGIPRPRVERLAREAGCEVVAVQDDAAAGADWVSFRYVLRRSAG